MSGTGFFSSRFGEMSRAERMSAVGVMDGLSLVRQCALAGVSRSSLYYSPAGESAENLALMREIDEVHLKYPFYGVRQMRSHLRLGGVVVGVNRVRRLMRVMGSGAVQPPPRTSSPAPGHRVYPYLLGGVDVVEPDQAWCADITYIPVMSGFFYLVAVMDWATGRVLSWQLSNTMEVGFCLGALEDALRTGTPEIFNTDQGSQFTSLAFTQRVLSSGARMSMDGRGRFMDNIFIERLWRSLKYEAVYLHELGDGHHARQVVGSWIDFYNHVRPHSALGGRTPASVYHGERPELAGGVGNVVHCKSTLRRVKLFSEGIHTPEYTLFLPSTCPINRDHLNIPSTPYVQAHSSLQVRPLESAT